MAPVVSDPPSSPPPPRAPLKRPAYLVVALLLVWVVGLAGATQGCRTVEILHRPDVARSENSRGDDVELARRGGALIDIVLAFRTTVTPLAVGQLLLASLLTLSAGLTLLGRGHARQLAIQAMVVYALFLPLDYFVRQPMRAITIDAFADGSAFPPGGPLASPELADQRALLWWVFRAALGLQLVILTFGIVAITRPRVRAFFDALASEGAREQEP
jgi:hypothetical protein